jgi:hypothetical protein
MSQATSWSRLITRVVRAKRLPSEIARVDDVHTDEKKALELTLFVDQNNMDSASMCTNGEAVKAGKAEKQYNNGSYK